MSSLNQHIKTVHDGVKPFECDKCGKALPTKSELTIHNTTVHEGIKAFKCTKCDKSFGRKLSISKDVRAHLCSILVDKLQRITLEELVQFLYLHSVSPRKRTHRRALSCLDNPDHRLIIFMHIQWSRARQQGLP